MGQIQVLSEILANQIAAGEVVERPASCIKELIENSLDAGANSLFISIEDGGISSMTVQDDGCGMDDADAKLAFSRHATSKIHHQRDLLRIATLGFRGEALASIGAVAQVTLQTRLANQPHGIEVVVNGGELQGNPKPVGIPPGTKIEVRNLFFNTPARLKYLRTVATEQARCVDVVQKAALSRPDVAFRLDVSGHTQFQTTGRGDPLEVMAALFGYGEAKQFLQLSGGNADYKVHGWIGRPNQSKASRNYGHLFVNQRAIRNIAVHQAVVAGFGNRLMVNRHPLYALYIEMDPTLVDVNIHPHKSEVRFSEERDLVQMAQQAVRSALDAAFLVPDAAIRSSFGRTEKTVQGELGISQSHKATAASLTSREPGERYHAMPSRPGSEAFGSAASGQLRPHYEKPGAGRPYVSPEAWKTVLQDGEPSVQESLDTDAAAVMDTDTPEVKEEIAVTLAEETIPRPETFRLRPIGQALGMYIVADDGEHLYVIDQHAAHERVLYEKFTKQMNEREVRSIALIAPVSLTLTGAQYTAVEEKLNLLSEMGLVFEPFGGRDMLLRQIPTVWEGLDYHKLTEDFLESLTTLSGREDVRDVLRSIVVTKACKAAIKANEYLSGMEIDALCNALSSLEDPFHCPHGRPVFIRLSSHELEKEFRRIV